MCIKSTCVLLAAASGAFSQYFATLYGHQAAAGILDGTEKTFLVTGYSTSFYPQGGSWPIILQQMLDEHTGGERVYHICSHTVWGTPIADWTDICGTGQHINDAIAKYVAPGSSIEAGVPKASVMLAQQSVQWAFGNCSNKSEEITGPDDEQRIAAGASAIVRYAQPFLDAGVDKVYLATHIYKTSLPLHLQGEYYAMERALDLLDGLCPGPELYEVTKSLWPAGFDADQVHPGPAVANAMALYWYIVLAGGEARVDVMQPVANAAGVSIPEGPTASHDDGHSKHDRGIGAKSRAARSVRLTIEGQGLEEIHSPEYDLRGRKVPGGTARASGLSQRDIREE